MKNFSSFYSKIDNVVNERMSKKKAQPSKGLVAKTNDGGAKKQADIYNQVADYIEAIRKQKKELMNGRK